MRPSRSRRPEGPVNLKVPAGTESGKLLRVKGRGAPKLKGGGKGDLLARVKVTVPQKLTKAEKEALEGYDNVLRERPRDRAFGAMSCPASLHDLGRCRARGHASTDAARLRGEGPRDAPSARRAARDSTPSSTSSACG